MNDEIKSFLESTFQNFDTNLKPYLDLEAKGIIDFYNNQLNRDNINESIPYEYNLNSIVNNVISSSNNIDEFKETILRLLINIILEYQYSLNSVNRRVNLQNFQMISSYPEDLVRIYLLSHKQNIIGNLAFVGTSEMIYRNIAENLNININPLNEIEYQYIEYTKELLGDNFDLLYKGNLNLIFSKLGKEYKENYLLNEIKSYINHLTPQELEQLNLTAEEKELLRINAGINFPTIEEVEQSETVLNTVDYVEKDNTKYVKFNDKDNNLHFAEVVGNITPQERVEKLKSGISTLPMTDTINADDISKEIENDMIVNSEFKNIKDVDTKDLDEETSLGVEAIKKEGYDDMKVDTTTGMIIDEQGNAYDANINENGKPEINKLNINSNKQDNIEINSDIDIETKKQLEEYGVPVDSYMNATDEQKRQIRDLYGIGKMPEENVNTNEKSSNKQFVLTNNNNINGYISSFIIAFVIGAFGGALATVILYLSR